MRIHRRRSIQLLSFLIVSCVILDDGFSLPEMKCLSDQCGDVLIQYPFSLVGSNNNSYYCGYKQLRLSCSGETTMFNTSTDSYIVKAINYTTQTLSLIDADVLGQNCPRVNNPLNISSSENILDTTSSDVQLEFFFNCTRQEELTPYAVVCLSTGETSSYVLPVNNVTSIKPSDLNCEGNVKSTVLREEWNGINGDITKFGSVLQEGFELKWKKTDSKNCNDCEISNGSCGYTNDTGYLVFDCFCKDGRVVSTDCRSSKSYFQS
ncbi:hypothetical protein ZOSMA_269G00130 [Zostera marina]|uniref:Uncharacterized protein n=1 Tax=Zostera marina TaxID=29655 RepID=A0A0K9PGR0_ZOSMR|nr:hypothetical protein ZOSMA_269G00130 [Zostera marina]